MPGYKIVFRIILVLAVLFGIGYGIFYLVKLSNNRLSTFYIYTNITSSKENVFLEENTAEDDGFIQFISENDSSFEQTYSFYIAQKLVLDEIGYNLYFAENRATGKAEVESKLYQYEGAMQAASQQVQIFLERQEVFQSSDGISNEEKEVLKNLATVAKEKLIVQANKLVELNSVMIPFVVKSSLGGDVTSSLKYSILDALHNQSALLGECLSSDNITIDEMSTVLKDNKSALLKYKNNKANGFSEHTTAGSDASNFVGGYNSLSESDKTEFLNAYDKKQFVEAESDETLIANLRFINKFLGWGV